LPRLSLSRHAQALPVQISRRKLATEPEELAYILVNSRSKILITCQAKRDIALAAVRQCPDITLCLIVDGPGDGATILNLDEATADFPDTPIAEESLGNAMLYSSGTTGRPKGILRPLPEQSPAEALPVYQALSHVWGFQEGQIFLSPAPFYHSAPNSGVHLTIRMGGTAIIMERFDPEQFLRLVETYRVTHTSLSQQCSRGC
jgi:long-chain acyl-CoA synthetase